MYKKVILLVLFGLVPFGLTGRCFADAMAEFEQAEGHRRNGDYLQAEQIYRAIVKDSPGTADALRAQRGLVIVYILTQRSFDAEAAVDELIADFSGYSDPNALAGVLFEVARQYEWSTKYRAANKIYQRIMDDHSASWFVNRANLAVVRTNIMSLIEFGKEQETQVAFNKLIVDFGGHEDLPQALYDIAKRYEWSHKYAQANDIFLQLVQRYPDSPFAAQVPLNVPRMNILSLIAAGEETAAEAAIGRLVSNFSGQPDLPVALYSIASKYEWTGEFEKAKSLYQQIAQQYPDSSYAGTAQLDVSKTSVLLLIESGKDNEAQTALDKLTADFKDYRSLASAVSWIAEQYQIKASELENEDSTKTEEIRDCLSKAIAIWERVINEFDDAAVVPQSCCYAGDCYSKLGEYAKSAECYQKVVNDYPGNSMAWHALFMVGRNYEELKKAGTISESEADAKTRAAYEQVVEKYPDCKAAKAAKDWLDRNNSNKGENK